MKHKVLDRDSALPLLLLGFGRDPEDRHHLMLGIPVNVGIAFVSGTKIFIALVPQQLHLWIRVAGKWEGFNLPLGPDVVKVRSKFEDDFFDRRSKGTLDDTRVAVGCVKLSVGPSHEVDERLGDFCLQLQEEAINRHGRVKVFDDHCVDKVIKIDLTCPIFEIGRVRCNPHELLVEVKAGVFGGS
jgi:hypothetical protein